jgi:hypothetical protein
MQQICSKYVKNMLWKQCEYDIMCVNNYAYAITMQWICQEYAVNMLWICMNMHEYAWHMQ